MMQLRVYTPEQPEGTLDTWAEFDRLYLEKCEEVNKLEREVEKYKSMAEIAIKQKAEIREQLEEARKTIRELAAEQLPFGFYPDVEPPEELPDELAESVPLWATQDTTSQDILCLSSALKNLYDIHRTDGWLLYTKLSKVLEAKIDAYSKEEG